MGLKSSKSKSNDNAFSFGIDDIPREPPPPSYIKTTRLSNCPGVRFDVHDVEVTTKPPSRTFTTASAGKHALRESWGTVGNVAYVSDFSVTAKGKLVVKTFSKYNTFAACVHDAFFKHYPLRLTPDALWIIILQGLAIHVDQNKEELRSQFVDFEGKETITIFRPEITVSAVKECIAKSTNGSIEWDSSIDEFTAKVRNRVKLPVHPMIDCDFSTTTRMDRICKNVAILDITKHYFELLMVCGCGIPWIELVGTQEDWEKLRQHALLLNNYHLQWWTAHLIPVLDEFINAFKGEVNINFWRAVVFQTGGSGMIGDPITGWLQAFFPYLSYDGNRTYHKNSDLGSWKQDDKCAADPSKTAATNHGFDGRRGGVSLDSFPSSTSTANFKLVDMGTNETMNMKYGAGLVAITYEEETHALEVQSGYAVLEDNDSARKSLFEENKRGFGDY